jgi:hypothetical protein
MSISKLAIFVVPAIFFILFLQISKAMKTTETETLSSPTVNIVDPAEIKDSEVPLKELIVD